MCHSVRCTVCIITEWRNIILMLFLSLNLRGKMERSMCCVCVCVVYVCIQCSLAGMFVRAHQPSMIGFRRWKVVYLVPAYKPNRKIPRYYNTHIHECLTGVTVAPSYSCSLRPIFFRPPNSPLSYAISATHLKMHRLNLEMDSAPFNYTYMFTHRY